MDPPNFPRRIMDLVMTEAKRLLATPDLTPTAQLVLHLYQMAVPGTKRFEENMEAERLFSFCLRRFPNCLSLKLCKFFQASLSIPDYDDSVRETALTRLRWLLDIQFRQRRIFLSTLVLRELEPIFFSCLNHEDISENSFKILSGVVTFAAGSAFTCSSEFRRNLLDYVSSVASTDSAKAICLFRDLLFPILDENEHEFMMVLEAIFPAILSRISEYPRHNTSDCDPAFGAAFPLAIKVSTTRADMAQNVAHALLNAIQQMVKDGREDCVRKVLEDWYMFAGKKVWYYKDEEYAFLKDLISMITGIEGIGRETLRLATQLLLRRSRR